MAVVPQPIHNVAVVVPIRAAQPSRISVVIPVYNQPEHLEKCLAALTAASDLSEIIVVDDGSTEDVHSVAKRAGVRYIRVPERRGAAAARNRGWRAAHGEFIAFVDSDVVVGPNVLSHMRNLLNENPILAGIFGSYDDEPADDNFYSQFRNLLHHYVHQVSKEQARTFWTGCGALRRSVLEEAGGFNEALPGMDDVELGMRLSGGGKLLFLDKSIQVKHLKKWTVASTVHTDIFLRAIPWTRLLAKMNMLPRDLNLGYRSRFSAVLVMLLFAIALLVPVSVVRGGWAASLPHYCVASAVMVLGLYYVNHGFYAFLARKRGLLFVSRAMAAHWFYYLYCGLTFLIVWSAARADRLGPGTAGNHGRL